MHKRIILLQLITKSTCTTTTTRRRTILNQTPKFVSTPTFLHKPSFKSYSSDHRNAGDDEWNNAWETAWLPDDLVSKSPSPWETDFDFGAAATAEESSSNLDMSSEATVADDDDDDVDTKAFVEDMNENWNERRKGCPNTKEIEEVAMKKKKKNDESLYSLDKIKKDYRLRKQRLHAGLWVSEIHKQQESALAAADSNADDDIDRLLDSCSEIFDIPNNELNNSEDAGSSELRNKPDGWETTSKPQDGNIWEMSQREEDILLQEFDRRIAYTKFQIASFIKTHIFSRRRPIDGWQYMIEELGPSSKKKKGSVSRLPNLTDSSTQPYKEERAPSTNRSYKGR